jgi:hypothetical protein
MFSWWGGICEAADGESTAGLSGRLGRIGFNPVDTMGKSLIAIFEIDILAGLTGKKFILSVEPCLLQARTAACPGT